MPATSSGSARGKVLYWLALTVLAIVGSAYAYRLTSAPRPPTVEEYLAGVGEGAKVAPAGFTLSGVTPTCRGLPIVLDSTLKDVAATHIGFIILNPERIVTLPKVVQLYAVGHECGHQIHGQSEEKSDCQAIVDGKAAGWLDAAGVGAICDFWKPYVGDNSHAPGPARCELMKRCFAEGMTAAGG